MGSTMAAQIGVRKGGGYRRGVLECSTVEIKTHRSHNKNKKGLTK